MVREVSHRSCCNCPCALQVATRWEAEHQSWNHPGKEFWLTSALGQGSRLLVPPCLWIRSRAGWDFNRTPPLLTCKNTEQSTEKASALGSPAPGKFGWGLFACWKLFSDSPLGRWQPQDLIPGTRSQWLCCALIPTWEWFLWPWCSGSPSARATVLREASEGFILHAGEAVAVQDRSRSWQAEPSAAGELGQGSPCCPHSRVHSSVMICNCSCAGS